MGEDREGPPIRPRLTYANIVATVALILALGGSSYAALEIGGEDVRNSSLTGVDVKNGSLRGDDVKTGSLRSSDIADEALLARDFKPGQLPAGPRGEQGERGATGPSGATKVTIRRTQVDVPTLDNRGLVAPCPAGQRATGGGGFWSTVPVAEQVIQETKASDTSGFPLENGETPRAWFVRGYNGTPDTHTLIVQVVCAAP